MVGRPRWDDCFLRCSVVSTLRSLAVVVVAARDATQEENLLGAGYHLCDAFRTGRELEGELA